jgi:SAM-dependent methyltransferase
MAKISSLLIKKNEAIDHYVKRVSYGLGRFVIPSLARQHKLDIMVGPTGYWKQLEEYQLKFLLNFGLQPFHTLLDIGCGPLQGGKKFIEYLDQNNYVGIDIRQEPMIEAYKRIAQYKLIEKNPTLILTDSFGQHELGGRTFDFFWISQLLYHLSIESIESLFKSVAHQMTSSSVLYGDIIDYKPKWEPCGYWREFKFYRHQPDDLEKIADKAGLRLEVLGQIADFGYPEAIALKTNYALKLIPKSSR